MIEATFKRGDDPLTAADLAVDRVLREHLPRDDEGWLSEETADTSTRLDSHRVWIVDPIDGTREFVKGIPEWCVSIGLVEDGAPVAGGILNPATGERVVGAESLGIKATGSGPVIGSDPSMLSVAASNSEIDRGEWARFEGVVDVIPCGSVAYKLGLVAAGRIDATWTLVPKHEWDVAGGAALVLASGGTIVRNDGVPPRWNQQPPWLPGFVAASPESTERVWEIVGIS